MTPELQEAIKDLFTAIYGLVSNPSAQFLFLLVCGPTIAGGLLAKLLRG